MKPTVDVAEMIKKIEELIEKKEHKKSSFD
jgi:hypothetical protein